MSQWEAWQQAGGDVHSIVADPMFVVAKHGDFRLKPDSPALKQGVRSDSTRQDRPLRRRRSRHLARPGGRRRSRTSRVATIRSDQRLNRIACHSTTIPSNPFDADCRTVVAHCLFMGRRCGSGLAGRIVQQVSQ